MSENEMMAYRGLTPYESMKIAHMQSKGRASGVGIAGLVLGCVGTVAGVTAWIFAPSYTNAKAKEAAQAAQAAKEIAAVRSEATQRQIDQMLSLYAAERQERIAGDINLTNTVNDSVSGSQQGTQSTSVMQSVEQNLLQQALLGNLSENPTKVQMYSAPQPCGCPCSCNG